MKHFRIIWNLGLFFLVSGALMGSAQAAFELIRPNPADFSEVKEFRNEWCARNSASNSSVRTICFGKSRFQNNRSVRAVVLQTVKGQKHLYIESEFPGVELLTLDFQIVGPVLSSGPEAVSFSEMGAIHLLIDAKGEVMSVSGSTSRLGQLRALRP